MYDRDPRLGGTPDPGRPGAGFEPAAPQPIDPHGTPSAARGDATFERTAYRDEMDSPVTGSAASPLDRPARLETGERVIELREEELVAHKDLRELGEVEIRTQVEEVPSRLEVEAYREEVEVEHVPVGQVVQERVDPYEENGILVVPVYEEQLVLVKRLVLREQLRIRRVATTETRLFEDLVRRERLIVEDPNDTGLVHEQYPTTGEAAADFRDDDRDRRAPRDHPEGGFFENLVRKALQ